MEKEKDEKEAEDYMDRLAASDSTVIVHLSPKDISDAEHVHHSSPVSIHRRTSLVSNFKRRMSSVSNLVVKESTSKMTEMKKRLSQRLSLQVLKQKVKKRLVGDKSTRLIRTGKCIYLDCLNCFPWSFLKWPRKISRSVVYHDFVFYGFVYALFASDGYLFACLLQGFGYEYNLYTAGVLATPDSPKPTALMTKMSLYPYAGGLIVLILASVISVVIGTAGYYRANRHYHYWYVSFIGGMLLIKVCLGVSVLPKEPFCNQVKPFMDEKLKFLVRNYYTTVNVYTKSNSLRGKTPLKVLKDKEPWKVRNYIHSSFMDVLQNHYFCCGYKSFQDYQDESLRYPTNDSRYYDWKAIIPRSCCTPSWNRNIACSLRVLRPKESMKDFGAKLYKHGCSQKMHVVCKNVFFYLGRGMLIFCAWQCLLFLVVLVCIAIQIRQIKRLERSSRFKVDPQILERNFRTKNSSEYDSAEFGKRTLQTTPANAPLDKWYRDFLESYRTHRDRYNQNRMHAAKFGFEPHSSTRLAKNVMSKMRIPLEKSPQGNIPIAVNNIKPQFADEFKKKYPHLRNAAVLSSYDTSINPWVINVAEERRHKYGRNELAIVQYNESDWEDSVKARLLKESDVLNSYHMLGHSHPKHKHPETRIKTRIPKKTKRKSVIPFQRKQGYPLGPSYMKSNWLPPNIETEPSSPNSRSDIKEAKLSELAKDPHSVFHKPPEEKDGNKIYIQWQTHNNEQYEIEQSQKQTTRKKYRRKDSVMKMKYKEFLASRNKTKNPANKINQPEIAPIRVNNLQYRTEGFPGPPPVHPLKTKAIAHSPAFNNAEIPTHPNVTSSQPEKNKKDYYKYHGEDLYKGTDNDQLRTNSKTELEVNPKSKVPFDKTYYKEQNADIELDTNTRTRFIGQPPETSAPKTNYVNTKKQRLEEKVKQFKWDDEK